MKRFCGYLSLLLALSCGRMDIRTEPDPAVTPPASTAKGTAYVFDDTALPRLTVQVSLDEWNRLLTLYDQDSKTREYIHCDAVFIKDNERTVVQDAGLRLRGQTSRRRPEGAAGQAHESGAGRWKHVHFGLHFRHFHKGDKDYDLRGVHRINLKYAKEDPTYIREKYCSDLLQRFGVWTAAAVSYCRLYIHVAGDPQPAYYGVYQMMEAVDDEYCENRPQFASDTGFLWKGVWGSNLRDRDDWRFGVGRKPDGGEYPYELKQGEEAFTAARAQLKDFIRNLNTLTGSRFEAWVKAHIDVDLLLRTYAVFVAVGHWDDYWNDMNNAYFYFDSRDPVDYRFYLIPYDMDNTLGTTIPCGAQTDALYQDPYRWGLDECVLMPKILSIAEFRQQYTAYLKALGAEDSPFAYPASMERIGPWQDLIRDHLANDTGEDQVLADRPASWSKHREYRVTTDGSYNWFRLKAARLRAL